MILLRSIGLRRKASGVTPVDSPLDLSGCSLWLDAQDATTLFTTFDGSTQTDPLGVNPANKVGRWEDKSSVGKNYTQETELDRPFLNDVSGIRRVNAANEWSLSSSMTDLVHSEALGCTLFARFEADSTKLGNPLFNASDRFNITTGSSGNINAVFRRINSDSVGSISFSMPAGVASYLATLRIDYQSGAVVFRINGEQVGTGTVTTGVPDAEGPTSIDRSDAGINRAMRVDEIIFYANALSNEDVERVEAYLQNKYD